MPQDIYVHEYIVLLLRLNIYGVECMWLKLCRHSRFIYFQYTCTCQVYINHNEYIYLCVFSKLLCNILTDGLADFDLYFASIFIFILYNYTYIYTDTYYIQQTADRRVKCVLVFAKIHSIIWVSIFYTIYDKQLRAWIQPFNLHKAPRPVFELSSE